MRRGWKMALSAALRCCRRVLSWVPVLVIVLVVLWSYYAYVFELCLVTVLSSAEKVIYLIFYHAIFVFFTWTYWKSIFTLPQQPNQKFHLSYTDKERYENEERPEVQKQMLVDIAKKVPHLLRWKQKRSSFHISCISKTGSSISHEVYRVQCWEPF
ncbi:zinc finger DHHC-type palmitoyltransferase 15 [Phyllostomus discolor]|uniref:Zinc finger DHHC-type palmitoyltransferase 15 n=1 Tax=Phyllostomus discolor TaxID=89673 RepID=A0A833ZG63_9CHIR|nr:zinc finger DHHC-type palmitoyltransferase 15 [Phyllostomus discolor]